MYDKFFKPHLVIVALVSGIVFAHPILLAQNEQDKDSIQRLLQTAKGKDQFDLLIELFKYELDKDNQAAFEYATKAHEESLNLADSLRIVKSARAKGSALMKLDNLDEAIRFFIYALHIARRNGYNDQIKFTLNALALAYTYQANYDKALDYHFQSLIIREAEGNKQEISVTYNNIGLVYYKLKDPERALNYFKKSLEIKREINDSYRIELSLINIGYCYNSLGQFEKAIEYLKEALSYCENATCDLDILTEGHFALGNAFKGIKDYPKAMNEYEISYEHAMKSNNKVLQVENLLMLSEISLLEGNRADAFERLKESEEVAKNMEYNELKIRIYNSFAKFYTSISDFEKASFYQGKYIQLRDSIYSEELIRNLTRVQTNYQERENIAIIASKEEALERQRRLNVAIVVIAVLSALLVFVLFRSNQIKKKVNTALTEAKGIIENQNKQLTTLNKNLEKMVDARTMELQIANEALKRVNDELDNFIYKTSHDIRGPLASLKGMCNVAIMDVQDELALSYFRKLDATAERLNTILTRLLIINQINNSSAGNELIDFKSIIDDVIVLERKKGLPPKLTIRKEVQEGIIFYSDKELIRIILENLIDNAIKFYNDSERIIPFVEIKVCREKRDLRIRVIDNGIGVSQINPDKIFQMFSRASERSGTGGIGLYLTKTATEKLGGQIDLRTTSDGYTEFFVRFTLNAYDSIAEVTL